MHSKLGTFIALWPSSFKRDASAILNTELRNGIPIMLADEARDIRKKD